VTYQGLDVAAEGLTAQGGQLKISFDESNPSQGNSHLLGVVSPFDGTISDELDYHGICSTAEFCEDLDALATSPSETVYSFNVWGEPFRRYSDLYCLGINPQSYTWQPPSFGSPSNQLGFNDFAFTNARMFATDIFPDPSYQLCELDPASFQLLSCHPYH